MYAVVGCSNCQMLWLLSNPETADTAQCPRCGKTHQTDRLKRLYESADRDAAREARAALLADKHDASEAFASVDHVSELEERVAEAGIDDAEYLDGVGVDADTVAVAGDTDAGETSQSHAEILRAAVRELTKPTEGEIIEYATDRGVPESKASDLLSKLCREGSVTENRGRYRLL